MTVVRSFFAAKRLVPALFAILAVAGCARMGPSQSEDRAHMPAAPAQTALPSQNPQTVPSPADTFVLDTGDVVRVSVFQSPDLLTETRVDESGGITFPLIGSVAVRGRTPSEVEARIADALERGQFLKQPQVTVSVIQFRSRQVAVLGNVNHPGRYPLDLRYTISDMLAVAGGVAATGADSVVLSRREDGKIVNREIDLESMFSPHGNRSDDVGLQPGDVIYVHRAPMFYVHGEVQRPGSFRVERDMTLRQAVATAGGVTPRGTLRGVRVERRQASGQIVELKPDSLDVAVQPDDVIYVRESIF